ncbi:class A sortase [Enterococcus hirae]|nr:class A sortase [Enterococcus hirae]
MKAKKKRRLSNLLILLLLLLGLGLVFNQQIKYWLMERRGDNLTIAHYSKKDLKKNNQKKANFDVDSVEPISTKAVLEAQLRSRNFAVIGGVAVPSVGINLPIFKGLDNTALLYGAGTVTKDQKMGEGNYSLASHRADRPGLLFTPLEGVKDGDKIYLTDLENMYTYTVYNKVRVQPDQGQYLDVVPDKKIVTLITCGEIEGYTRIVVQGELSDTQPVEKASAASLAAFKLARKTY